MAESLYNPRTFWEDLSRVIQAARMARSIRACLLTTRDREYALSMVRKAAVSSACPLYHFTVAGRRRYHAEQLKWDPVGSDSSDAPGLLRHAQELRGGGLVVFEDCIPFLRDDGGDTRMRISLAQMISAETSSEGLVLVFVEPPESAGRLPAILADQFVRLDIPYPRLEELETIAREEIALACHQAGRHREIELIQREAVKLASGMVGLTRSAARNAIRDALAPDPMDFGTANAHLQRRKSEQLSRELAMNVLETRGVEEPIGLDYLVDYLLMAKGKMRISGPGRARGILLIGPPGAGKTMLARAVGHLVDLPVVEFRIASLMNSLLGETERRFSQAFATLEAMAPNVVFIDEIEKAFGDSSERDGGTMMRCTGSLLSWLSDNPYPNFIVATSNSLQRMGEIGLTMTRSERFDASFFVDIPDTGSRRLMLERWLAGKTADHQTVAHELAAVTEKFSGADLRSLVKQAIARAEHLKRSLSLEILKTEAERKRMRALALYDEFQPLRRWGRIYCDPAGPTEH